MRKEREPRDIVREGALERGDIDAEMIEAGMAMLPASVRKRADAGEMVADIYLMMRGVLSGRQLANKAWEDAWWLARPHMPPQGNA